MTYLEKQTKLAKQIRKAHPKKTWIECVQAAAKQLKKAPLKKAATKKVAKKVGSVKATAKVKSVAKKAGVRLPHGYENVKAKRIGAFEGSYSKDAVHWLALVPQKGKPTKTDQTKINKIIGRHKVGFKIMGECLIDHFGGYKKAYETALLLQNKLGKRYYGYIFLDKQFGKADKDGDIKLTSNNKVKLTGLQKQSVILI